MAAAFRARVAEFFFQRRQILALDRVGNLVGFLDRVRGDGREGLLHVPRAATVRIAELSHHVEHGLGRGGVAGEGFGAVFCRLFSYLARHTNLA